MAVCGAKAGHATGDTQGATSAETLKDFVAKTLKEDGNGNWPTSTTAKNKEPKAKTNDNAEAVAKDLAALNSDEKTIVAGLLAKTIEGGEVVEIRAVSSTSVMVNSSGYA
ncbi:hypothetical protein ANAPH1_01030 [Anaplasma phagocytophilum]|nr:hypothetical protein ANAPH1_01030 [Anaplasma phagocytophilum]